MEEDESNDCQMDRLSLLHYEIFQLVLQSCAELLSRCEEEMNTMLKMLSNKKYGDSLKFQIFRTSSIMLDYCSRIKSTIEDLRIDMKREMSLEREGANDDEGTDLKLRYPIKLPMDTCDKDEPFCQKKSDEENLVCKMPTKIAKYDFDAIRELFESRLLKTCVHLENRLDCAREARARFETCDAELGNKNLKTCVIDC
ncbi:hypothetical protein CHUAL_005292 [Chamberlinius hualienensis]